MHNLLEWVDNRQRLKQVVQLKGGLEFAYSIKKSCGLKKRMETINLQLNCEIKEELATTNLSKKLYIKRRVSDHPPLRLVLD
jgi:hypothetical protein